MAKLLMVVVQDRDADAAIEALSQAGHGVTRLASSGGLLRARILAGAEMVGAPQQARRLGLGALRAVRRIDPVAAFGHLVDDG